MSEIRLETFFVEKFIWHCCQISEHFPFSENEKNAILKCLLKGFIYLFFFLSVDDQKY